MIKVWTFLITIIVNTCLYASISSICQSSIDNLIIRSNLTSSYNNNLKWIDNLKLADNLSGEKKQRYVEFIKSIKKASFKNRIIFLSPKEKSDLKNVLNIVIEENFNPRSLLSRGISKERPFLNISERRALYLMLTKSLWFQSDISSLSNLRNFRPSYIINRVVGYSKVLGTDLDIERILYSDHFLYSIKKLTIKYPELSLWLKIWKESSNIKLFKDSFKAELIKLKRNGDSLASKKYSVKKIENWIIAIDELEQNSEVTVRELKRWFKKKSQGEMLIQRLSALPSVAFGLIEMFLVVKIIDYAWLRALRLEEENSRVNLQILSDSGVDIFKHDGREEVEISIDEMLYLYNMGELQMSKEEILKKINNGF